MLFRSDAKFAVFVDEQDKACKLILENLNKTKLDKYARVTRCDYEAFLKNCREKFNIVFLDPPYEEKFLENALNLITEIDILQSGGIIVTERPAGKELVFNFPGYSRSKDYKYTNTVLTIFRKE